MVLIFAWFLLSFLVGAAGSEREIGFWGSFILSLLFSPLIGFIMVALSRRKERKPQEQKPKEQEQENDSGFNIDDFRAN